MLSISCIWRFMKPLVVQVRLDYWIKCFSLNSAFRKIEDLVFFLVSKMKHVLTNHDHST